jgi:hypothetical protein
LIGAHEELKKCPFNYIKCIIEHDVIQGQINTIINNVHKEQETVNNIQKEQNTINTSTITNNTLHIQDVTKIIKNVMIEQKIYNDAIDEFEDKYLFTEVLKNY